MDTEYFFILIGIISFGFSFLLVPLALKISAKYNLTDGPKDQKRISELPIPTVGGIIFFILFLLFSLFFIEFNLYFLCLATIIFILGLYDDIFNLRPLYKFSLPFAICCFTSFFMYTIDVFENTAMNYFLTIIWIFGLTNSFNFLDNMDGIFPGVVTINSFFLFIFSYLIDDLQMALVFLLFFAINLGILFYNFPPASIYMGDNGSLLQGFLISTLLIKMNWQFGEVNYKLFVPVFFLGYTIFDTSYVTICRVLNGRKPWIGDINHSSHKLIKLGYSFRQSALIVYFFTTFFCISGILIYFNNFTAALLVISLNVAVISIYIRNLNQVKFNA